MEKIIQIYSVQMYYEFDKGKIEKKTIKVCWKKHIKKRLFFFLLKASLPSKTYLNCTIKNTYKYDFYNTPKLNRFVGLS